MWERKVLKSNAKQELKISYWLSFLVCLVAIALIGGISGGSGSAATSGSGISELDPSQFTPEMMQIFFGILSVVYVIVIITSIFFINPLIVGEKSFFVRAPRGDRQFSNLFSSFKGGRYGSIVKTMFLTNLFIALWSLLFIIPGIIKTYQYILVPYIISDDPSLSPKQAMELSRRMTDGEKLRIFVLQLSFIGWIILAAIPVGLGLPFLMPYVEATYAQLYSTLREKVKN